MTLPFESPPSLPPSQKGTFPGMNMTVDALFEKEERELLLLLLSPHNMFLFLCLSVIVVFLFGIVFGFIIARLPKFPNNLNREKAFVLIWTAIVHEYCKTVVT